MLMIAAIVLAHVNATHLANLVPIGMTTAPDSQYCRDGSETALGYQLHVSCGPEDKTVRSERPSKR